jgi:pilus assembly protein CpaE
MFSPGHKREPAPAQVKLVTSDDILEARLRLDLEGDPRFDLQVMRSGVGNVASLPDVKGNGAIFVIDIDPSHLQEIAALENLVTTSLRDVPVIVMSDNLGGEMARRLLQLQVCDWLPRSVDHRDFVQACQRALRPRVSNGHDQQARCIAFYPAMGGVGNTTLAITSAFVLGRGKRPSPSVCLVDLDLQSGTIADYLDLPPNIQLENVGTTPDRLDDHLLEVLLSRHPSGIALLAAPNSLTAFDTINHELVTRLLDLAIGRFSDLVIDLPRQWLPWSESVLRGADQFFIVTELSVPGLHQARRIADEMEKRFSVPSKGRVIVNKYRWLGGHGVRKRDAQEALGERLAGFVSETRRLVRESHNRGVAPSELQKSNRLEKDMTAILQRVEPRHVAGHSQHLEGRA